MQPKTLEEWSYLDHITPGIPVSWYLDDDILAVEKEVLFDAGPGYVGHELLVPEPGDYQTLSWAEGWNSWR